jgi:hypothetical protein
MFAIRWPRSRLDGIQECVRESSRPTGGAVTRRERSQRGGLAGGEARDHVRLGPHTGEYPRFGSRFAKRLEEAKVAVSPGIGFGVRR